MWDEPGGPMRACPPRDAAGQDEYCTMRQRRQTLFSLRCIFLLSAAPADAMMLFMREHPDYEIAARRYQGGATLVEAAKGLCHTSALHRYLVRHRIPRRRQGPANGPRNPARLAKVIAMRARGLTHKQIAARLGVSKQAVHQYLQWNGAS